MKMLNTSECENCIYCTLDESNIARIKVYCEARNKTYYYGQCVPCEEKKVKPNEEKMV